MNSNGLWVKRWKHHLPLFQDEILHDFTFLSGLPGILPGGGLALGAACGSFCSGLRFRSRDGRTNASFLAA